MNVTESTYNTTIVLMEAAPYLNQSMHTLLPGSSHAAIFINTPYQVLLSLKAAIAMQFHVAKSSVEDYPSFHALLDSVEFFCSRQAILCLATALIINKFITGFIVFRGRNPRLFSMKAWYNPLLHLSSIAILSYYLIRPLRKDFQNPELYMRLDVTSFIFAWSLLTESILSLSFDRTPLESSDATLFELCLYMFILKQQGENHVSAPLALDCMLTMANRLLIHTLEFFQCRKYRLLGSTITSLTHLFFTVRRVYLYKGDMTKLSTFTTYFPRFFFVCVILTSLLCYLLAIIVRFDGSFEHIKDLEAFSFMDHLISHLNCTGEEDFTLVAGKLATMLCVGISSKDGKLNAEFSPLIVPDKINTKFMNNGYSNRIKEVVDYDETTSTAKKMNGFTSKHLLPEIFGLHHLYNFLDIIRNYRRNKLSHRIANQPDITGESRIIIDKPGTVEQEMDDDQLNFNENGEEDSDTYDYEYNDTNMHDSYSDSSESEFEFEQEIEDVVENNELIDMCTTCLLYTSRCV